jgi:hypothetical protein
MPTDLSSLADPSKHWCTIGTGEAAAKSARIPIDQENTNLEVERFYLLLWKALLVAQAKELHDVAGAACDRAARGRLRAIGR